MSQQQAKFDLFLSSNRTNRLRKDGTSHVALRIYLNGKERWLNTKIYIKPMQWDEKRKQVKKHPLALEYNQQLQNLLNKAIDYQMELIKRKIPLHLDHLVKFESEHQNLTFTEFFAQQLNVVKITMKPGTYKSHKTIFNRLSNFRHPIFFHELDFRFLSEYNTHLLENGASTNYAGKHHRVIKRYVNEAISHGYISPDDNPYKRFKIKTAPAQEKFLLPDELKQIEELTFPPQESSLEQCRDFFLYLTYTGSRYETASEVLVSDILETSKGFMVSRGSDKTEKLNDLPLYLLFPHPDGGATKPERIVRKFLNLHKELYDGDLSKSKLPLFLGFTIQHLNRQLKEIASRIECRKVVKDHLSTHFGRHTFGTILSDKVDNIVVVQELMQHADITTTRRYLHLNRKYLKQALKQIDWDG
jgi:integrase